MVRVVVKTVESVLHISAFLERMWQKSHGSEGRGWGANSKMWLSKL